jgi:hypothetical protein
MFDPQYLVVAAVFLVVALVTAVGWLLVQGRGSGRARFSGTYSANLVVGTLGVAGWAVVFAVVGPLGGWAFVMIVAAAAIASLIRRRRSAH